MENKIVIKLNNDTQLELVQKENEKVIARWVETSTNEVWEENEVNVDDIIAFIMGQVDGSK